MPLAKVWAITRRAEIQNGRHENNEKSIFIQILSLNGRIVYDVDYNHIKHIEVPHHFSPGSYIVKCTAGSSVSHTNIVVTP